MAEASTCAFPGTLLLETVGHLLWTLVGVKSIHKQEKDLG